jgi:hypothetical protein
MLDGRPNNGRLVALLNADREGGGLRGDEPLSGIQAEGLGVTAAKVLSYPRLTIQFCRMGGLAWGGTHPGIGLGFFCIDNLVRWCNPPQQHWHGALRDKGTGGMTQQNSSPSGQGN